MDAGAPTKGFALTTKRLRPLITVTAVTIAAALPSTASAGLVVADASNCASTVSAQVFQPFADPAYYTLQPGGDFEPSSPDWDLTGGAGLASGNEPWNLTGRQADNHSLALGSGSSATSGTMCVGLDNPTIRFFTRASSSLATLKVEVLFFDANGAQQSAQIGLVKGSSAWAPTAQIPIVANLLPLLPDGRTPVAFRLTATGGNWAVDDFYVDPMQRW